MLVLLLTIDNEEDRSKMECIIDLYSEMMHLQATLILKNYEDAEDAVQMAMVNICKHIKNISDLGSNRTKWYVLEAAKNAAIDIYRKKKRRWEKEVSFDEIFPNDEMIPQYDGENETVKHILELSTRDRDILMLKYVYGYEYEEVAMILGISTEAAKKAGQRARNRLEKSLEKGDSNK